MKNGVTQLYALCSGGFKPAYILDVVLVALFFVLSFVGARRGGISSVIGLVSTLLAVVLAFVFVDKVAGLFEGSLTEWVGGKLEKTLLKIKGFDIDLSVSGMEEALKGVSLPSFVKEFLVEEFADKSLEAGTTLAEKAGVAMAGFLVKIISWILIFLSVKLVLAILAKILTKICAHVTFANAVNVLLGACVGILKAFVFSCGALALLSLIPSQAMTNFFNQTYIVKYLYHDNPLVKLIIG